MKKFNFSKGRFGESLVLKYLKKNGYKIIQKNYKAINTESDIIAIHKTDIVFIEVKSRMNYDYGYPSEAITSKKIKKLRLNAKIFLSNYSGNYEGIRFDVIEVNLSTKDINHIIGAF